MANLGQFDPNAHKPLDPREPLPTGWYPMAILNSEVRKTRDGKGAFLWLELEIVESMAPQCKGRRAWDRLNLWNENADAVRIAESALTSICKAVGQTAVVTDTTVLHGRPFAVRLKARKETNEFDAQNKVKDYDTIAARFPGGAVAASQGVGQAQPAAAAAAPMPATPATPPWQQPQK